MVSKSDRSAELFNAIRATGSGEVVLTTAMAGLAQLSQRRGLLKDLSRTKVQVLNLLAKGMRQEAIAQELHLSRHTVDKYSIAIRRSFADLLRRTGQVDGLHPDDRHTQAAIAKALGLGPGDLLNAGEDMSSEPRPSGRSGP